MSQKAYWLFLCMSYIVFAGIFALPHINNALRHGDESMMLMFTTDDGFYQARIKAGLLRRFAETRNGMTGGDPPAQGANPALIESVVGTAFSWTGLHAPELTALLTIVITPLLFPLLAGLLRRIGVGRGWSLIGAATYLFLLLPPIQKPVHVSLSLPLTFAALLLLIDTWKKPDISRATVTGMLLGLLTLVYFWAWTFLWAVWGSFLVLHVIFDRQSNRTRSLMLTGCVMLLASIPYWWDLWTLKMSEPAFLETALRSTLVKTRAVESLPRSALLALMAASSMLFAWKHRTEAEHWMPALAVIVGIAIAMHQNMLHGMRLSFVSHYYAFVCLAALLALAWVSQQGPRALMRGCIGLIAVTFLAAAAWDYGRLSIDMARGIFALEHLQHLRPVLRFLEDGTRETVLTDKRTAHMVSSWTDVDVVFTAYTKHLLMDSTEYAERYCLTEHFSPTGPDYQWLGREVVEGWDVKNVAGWMEVFQQTCKSFLANPKTALQKYNVTWLLWNERMHPDWKIDTRLFTLEEQGNGWSLWKIR